jgi:hypothetical protein
MPNRVCAGEECGRQHEPVLLCDCLGSDCDCTSIAAEEEPAMAVHYEWLSV